jgi:hypothetical protein
MSLGLGHQAIKDRINPMAVHLVGEPVNGRIGKFRIRAKVAFVSSASEEGRVGGLASWVGPSTSMFAQDWRRECH